MATAIERSHSVDVVLDSMESELDEDRLFSLIPTRSRGSTYTLIQTAHSTYLFLMTLPAARLGLLVGGAVGECPTTAVFLGAIPHEDRSHRETTWRAVFDIPADGEARRLITGPIVNVIHEPIAPGAQESRS